ANSVATPLERHLSAIADVSEMSSTSTVGQTRIAVQFGLNRSIDGAARDVQAAINAARADLPSNLRGNPTYRKVNPADAPIMVLALTSDTLTQGQVYDAAATVLEQKLSQIEGVGQVALSGSSLPAVRVEINPKALFAHGISLENVRAAIGTANAHAPKGAIEDGELRFQIHANDQARKADDYRSLVIAYRGGAPVRLSDVAEIIDSVENIRNAGLANGKPSVLAILYRQPGANIIETVDRVRALMPRLAASMAADIDVSLAIDRSTTIRSSLRHVEIALAASVVLVIFVVFAFLRDVRAALIPSTAVLVSLIGTFGFMYLLDYSLDNLSLMALTIATGFVVDDAIVVLENVSRHIENGANRLRAAIDGTREVAFTVLSMSLSLIAVFIPILLMGGIVGRYFREFAVTLSIAILVSLVVSLTTTPMMCAVLLRPRRAGGTGRFVRAFNWVFGAIPRGYAQSLGWALDHPKTVMLILFATIGLNFHLFAIVPKGFFPQQDTGRIVGGIQADQSISFQLMRQKLALFIAILGRDPAMESVVGFTGGAQTNAGLVFASLKPRDQRDKSLDEVIGRLRRQLAVVPGASLFLQGVQDIRVGGRPTHAQFQFTLLGDNIEDLYAWTPRIFQAMQAIPQI
ncbi:MAG: nodulation protein, partial [Alphaproteobacteria bacterium]|nr:nodulation protein [Alphaproteobacteria bacterium]